MGIPPAERSGIAGDEPSRHTRRHAVHLPCWSFKSPVVASALSACRFRQAGVILHGGGTGNGRRVAPLPRTPSQDGRHARLPVPKGAPQANYPASHSEWAPGLSGERQTKTPAESVSSQTGVGDPG